MEIVDVETNLVDQYLFVQVRTDEDITGIGESGTWQFLESSKAAVETFKRYLIGEDPLQIDHHWQYMYRNANFRGAAIMGAISAIDIALWDIAGKYYDVPVHQLLGGKCRDKARVYAHGSTTFGNLSTEDRVNNCLKAMEDGFTAVGYLIPLEIGQHDDPYFETYAQKIGDATERVKAFREAVGNEVDLCIEIHKRLDPAEAIALANQIEPYNPMFYEDPIRPDNFDAMAEVSQHINIPIATGERLNTIQEFEMLLNRNAVQYIRPDVCVAGGLTHTKKIAALAEAHHVGVIPHNPLGPVSAAACLQLAASIPNFTILEYPYKIGEERGIGDELTKTPLERDGGFLIVPDKPGIGIELDEDTFADHPYEPRKFVTRLHEDGSVIDQ